MERMLVTPAVQGIFASHEPKLYGIFDTIKRLDQGPGSTPDVSVQEWLQLFKQNPVKGVTRSQTVMIFALSQDMTELGIDGKVENQLMQVLDFAEFKEALGRLAFLSMSTKEKTGDSDIVLTAFATRLGPFIEELGKGYKEKKPPKSQRMQVPLPADTPAAPAPAPAAAVSESESPSPPPPTAASTTSPSAAELKASMPLLKTPAEDTSFNHLSQPSHKGEQKSEAKSPSDKPKGKTVAKKPDGGQLSQRGSQQSQRGAKKPQAKK